MHPRYQPAHSFFPRFSFKRAGSGGTLSLWWLVLLLLMCSPELTAASLVNINTASAIELAQQLPGIGPVKAEAIVAYRETNGAFTRVDDLLNVTGIGPATLNRLRPLITVEGSESAGSESELSTTGTAPFANLTRQQIELMARAATRAAIQMAIEDARGYAARDPSN